MRARRGATGADGAFTLVELMVVIILLGVAFSYGLIKIDLLIPNARLEKAARDLGSFLTRLRGMAVFHGRSYFLEYDLDDHRYRIVRPANLAELEDGAEEWIETSWFELPSRIAFKDVQLSDADEFTSGTLTVEFTPTGEVTGHIAHLISDEITNEDRNKFSLELNAITGLVTYTHAYKEYRPVRDEFEFR